MSSIVTRILRSVVIRLLSSHPHYFNAAELKDGDSAGKIGLMIVRELEDIKSRCDGLARKDLLTILSYLKEGIGRLCMCLEKEPDLEVATDQTPEDQVETSRMSCVAQSKNLNEALELSHAIEKLENSSAFTRFVSAKDRFGEARKRAAETFCNTALSTADRILATKCRVISSILENLDSPGIAISSCLFYLRDLHSLPDICKIFSVYLNRSKSLFGGDERVEHVKSVMLINYVLFEFNLKFSSDKLTDRYIWPATITLDGGRSFNPILDWREVATRKSLCNEMSPLDDPYKLLIHTTVIPVLSVVNNRQLVVVEEKVE